MALKIVQSLSTNNMPCLRQHQQSKISAIMLLLFSYILDITFFEQWFCFHSQASLDVANLINSLIHAHNLPETFFFSRSGKMEMAFSFHRSEHLSQTAYLWFLLLIELFSIPCVLSLRWELNHCLWNMIHCCVYIFCSIQFQGLGNLVLF